MTGIPGGLHVTLKNDGVSPRLTIYRMTEASNR
jgi:hypothetical protein